MSVIAPATGGTSVLIDARPRWLRVAFDEDHALLGFPIVGGARSTGRVVLWHEVKNSELSPGLDVRAFVTGRLAAIGEPVCPTFLTSRSLDHYHVRTVEREGVSATAVATVGLGNALRAGDSPGDCTMVGTINVLCRASVALDEAAMLEMLAIVVEARTLAIRESGVVSRRSGAPASGTGTDCVIVACPLLGTSHAHAGKHTAVGHAVGLAVREAVLEGALIWKEAHAWT